MEERRGEENGSVVVVLLVLSLITFYLWFQILFIYSKVMHQVPRGNIRTIGSTIYSPMILSGATRKLGWKVFFFLEDNRTFDDNVDN